MHRMLSGMKGNQVEVLYQLSPAIKPRTLLNQSSDIKGVCDNPNTTSLKCNISFQIDISAIVISVANYTELNIVDIIDK